MRINIDNDAGFCFGVAKSIELAEQAVLKTKSLKCLGQLVHNEQEVQRLEDLGVEFIDYDKFSQLTNATVLLRAHGEPPETYEIAKRNNIELIDATCSIVSSLQNKIYCSWEELSENGGQLVIFGDANHPEVLGLNGQTKKNAIIVNNVSDFSEIDFTLPIHLFTQTTKSKKKFEELAAELTLRAKNEIDSSSKEIKINNSICKHVSNREESIIRIAKDYKLVLFVAGKNSSNGKMLFDICKTANPNSYYISSIDDIIKINLEGVDSIGITGATSSPQWLMRKIKTHLEDIFN